jgi:hypothetical protein
MSRAPIAVVLGAALTLAGCNSRPHAPALLNEPIYQDDYAGFRVEIPAGWVVYAKTNLPRGEPVSEERKLIGYKLTRADKPAMFEISCVDLPDGADLIAHFTRNLTGSRAWRPDGKPESLMLGSMPAQRLVFLTGTGAKAERKEVVAVRLSGRNYFFTAVSAPDDSETRDAVRRVVSQIAWKSN